jgi:hypothetical protein
MKANWIRYRLKKDRQIYECHPLNLKEDGRLVHTRKIKWGDEWANEDVLLNPNEYEIIPQEDFFEFRRNTARQILCTLMEKESNYDDESLITKAIEITDKLIEKL